MATDLVISAYCDPLDWVGQLECPAARLFVYDKWDGNTREDYFNCFGRLSQPWRARLTVERLPNQGLCDHSYLHHIVTCYDDLAGWTVFSPDGPHDHLPEGVTMDGCLVPGDSLKVPRLWRGRDWGPDGRLNWKLWDNLPCRRGKSWGQRWWDGEIAPAKLSFVEWARQFVGFDPDGADWPGYAPGGIMAVPRRAITYLPVEFYARLREQLSHARESEEGHYMERLWTAIFQGKARYLEVQP